MGKEGKVWVGAGVTVKELGWNSCCEGGGRLKSYIVTSEVGGDGGHGGRGGEGGLRQGGEVGHQGERAQAAR